MPFFGLLLALAMGMQPPAPTQCVMELRNGRLGSSHDCYIGGITEPSYPPAKALVLCWHETDESGQCVIVRDQTDEEQARIRLLSSK
jgi:hypothetical protein